ncbi:tetraspanin-18-like [Haliotis rufescens]|uniref:tetraspanin-18-like n=1 Tax=Haliotis rufescens TaxID=6454 RepID=UPI00201E9B1C|nr:tetraspanin-18-like [Haliotis rufescens]XP_048247285.1 tetraspanin-18-like [Haliotis rufescens]
MCKCFEVIGRIVIGILSVIFAILGFVLLVFGIMVKVQSDVIQNLFQSLIDMAKQQAKSAIGSGFDLPTDNFNINDLVGGLAIVFIIIGVVMLFIGVLGIAGACCMVKCMIVLYLIVNVIFLISQIALVAIAASNRGIITDPPKAGLKSSLQQEYQGVNGTDVTSLLWNVVMNGLQCCGIDDSQDFLNATKWTSVWGPGTTPNFQTPAACCKSGLFTDSDKTCAKTPTTTNNNKDTGCYEKIWDFIFKGTTFIIFACADIGGFALLTIFSGIILHQILQKNKVGNMA